MLTDIQLFECFKIELPNGGNLWNVKQLKNKAEKKLVKKPGDPGTKERIAIYAARAAENKPLFED